MKKRAWHASGTFFQFAMCNKKSVAPYSSLREDHMILCQHVILKKMKSKGSAQRNIFDCQVLTSYYSLVSTQKYLLITIFFSPFPRLLKGPCRPSRIKTNGTKQIKAIE